MEDKPRLIEKAFCLKQASLDSVHEKNVRHGHISTLHIWPARRPLAACRAALIATLLPDPGTKEERDRILEKLAGKVVKNVHKKKMPDGRIVEQVKEETVGGILHWGRETENRETLDWFRDEIRKAYGGRAPKVLDPFAGGGAIPLEAMRLGCETTAIDINPVAWFILKCTLEYPQKLAGQKRPLPNFILDNQEFMKDFFKAHPGLIGQGKPTEKQMGLLFDSVHTGELPVPDADLAWHVRAWGWWVLRKAKEDLARFYPVVDGKPTVAYLWARMVTCKSCRMTLPLLKTRWLCKKDKKRVLLTMEPKEDGTGVAFGVQMDVPAVGGNAAQKREHDKKIGAGTMSRSGAKCPCCPAFMTMEDIRLEGRAGRLGAVMTAVVVDGKQGKEYRLPTDEELKIATEGTEIAEEIKKVFAEIPFGIPEEPTPTGGSGASRAFSVDGYGIDKWYKLFTPRQLLAIGTILKHIRDAKGAMKNAVITNEWHEAIESFLSCGLGRFLDFANCGVQWKLDASTINHSFVRFALPITWDYAEGNPLGDSAGSYSLCYDRICTALDTYHSWELDVPKPDTELHSAKGFLKSDLDAIVTDPPYYDAIPYSDLMDFFYVWLRRTLYGISPEINEAFKNPLGPKWDHESNDGELIDDSSRHGGDKEKSKKTYEDGMYNAFLACHKALKPNGRLVIVFAHKHPDAWETLVSATIRAGFVVDASWPIQTEMVNRTRALSSAALSSSVWLVCRKRPDAARPGWDNHVLEEMRKNIETQLRDFWDAGIRGPDFVWAATGPALEAYSKHPVVKKANEPGQVMEVSEFLRHVRRIVVDFVVGRVLSGNGDAEAVNELDDVTTYYLLHRYDFGMDDAPAGACILYAISCGMSDRELAANYDILVQTKGAESGDEQDEATGDEDVDELDDSGSGSKVRLKTWKQRNRKSLGEDTPARPAPLIDRVHRLMHLWRAGDVVKVDTYIDGHGLRRNHLFHQLLQALIELSGQGTEERSLLENISNHLSALGVRTVTDEGQMELATEHTENTEGDD